MNPNLPPIPFFIDESGELKFLSRKTNRTRKQEERYQYLLGRVLVTRGRTKEKSEGERKRKKTPVGERITEERLKELEREKRFMVNRDYLKRVAIFGKKSEKNNPQEKTSMADIDIFEEGGFEPFPYGQYWRQGRKFADPEGYKFPRGTRFRARMEKAVGQSIEKNIAEGKATAALNQRIKQIARSHGIPTAIKIGKKKYQKRPLAEIIRDLPVASADEMRSAFQIYSMALSNKPARRRSQWQQYISDNRAQIFGGIPRGLSKSQRGEVLRDRLRNASSTYRVGRSARMGPLYGLPEGL